MFELKGYPSLNQGYFSPSVITFLFLLNYLIKMYVCILTIRSTLLTFPVYKCFVVFIYQIFIVIRIISKWIKSCFNCNYI